MSNDIRTRLTPSESMPENGNGHDELLADELVSATPAAALSATTFREQDIRRDIDGLLWSFQLQGIRRYYQQRFWREESVASDYALKVEGFPRLETVAEHSWHVADSVLLLADHFPSLDSGRCLELAVIHDKLEIVTGDKSPLGRDGTGHKAHAFNGIYRLRKELSEREALSLYLSQLRPSARDRQQHLFEEVIAGQSAESRFVRAVDKLQSFAYVLLKKLGHFEDRHLHFTLRYSAKAVEYFPGLAAHYAELRRRFMIQVARRRGLSVSQLEQSLRPIQLSFEFT